MLLKTNETKNGRDVYVNAKTGEKQTLIRATGKHKGRIPGGVFMRHIVPMSDQKWIAEMKKMMFENSRKK